jgi:hypothetical protein
MGCCTARLAVHFVEQPTGTTEDSEEGARCWFFFHGRKWGVLDRESWAQGTARDAHGGGRSGHAVLLAGAREARRALDSRGNGCWLEEEIGEEEEGSRLEFFWAPSMGELLRCSPARSREGLELGAPAMEALRTHRKIEGRRGTSCRGASLGKGAMAVGEMELLRRPWTWSSPRSALGAPARRGTSGGRKGAPAALLQGASAMDRSSAGAGPHEGEGAPALACVKEPAASYAPAMWGRRRHGSRS